MNDWKIIGMMMFRKIRDMELEIEVLKETAQHTAGSKRYEECKKEISASPKMIEHQRQYNATLESILEELDMPQECADFYRKMLAYLNS